jgi:hypothetical protein
MWLPVTAFLLDPNIVFIRKTVKGKVVPVQP